MIDTLKMPARALAAVAAGLLALGACADDRGTTTADEQPAHTESGSDEPAVEEPATIEPDVDESEAIMPDVMCMDLQSAQDTIQEAGVFFSGSHDATGEDRMQIMDSNWQVVGQNPKAGSPIGEFDATLDVVKFGEPSPCSAGTESGSDEPAVEEPATIEPDVDESEAIMPDVMCMDLQSAQDTIQEAGVFFSGSHDATGEDRMQIMDSNWQVVGQNPKAGSPIGEFDATLDVVKFGEPSPC